MADVVGKTLHQAWFLLVVEMEGWALGKGEAVGAIAGEQDPLLLRFPAATKTWRTPE